MTETNPKAETPEQAGATDATAETPKEIHTYKPKFGEEEIVELLTWFRERLDQIPHEPFRINKSTTTPDLHHTVERYLLTVGKFQETPPQFSGYVAHLLLIRIKLQAAGLV